MLFKTDNPAQNSGIGGLGNNNSLFSPILNTPTLMKQNGTNSSGPSLFGGVQAPQTQNQGFLSNQGGMFGGTAPNTNSPFASNLMGASNQPTANNSQQGGFFSAPPQQNNNFLGAQSNNSFFSAKPPATPNQPGQSFGFPSQIQSGFLQTNAQAQNPQANAFGQQAQTNAFGQQAQTNAFGQQAQNNAFRQQAQTNAFGQPAQTSLFNQGGMFGSSNNAFGQTAAPVSNNNQGNMFGQTPQSNNSFFGQNNQQTNAFGLNNAQKVQAAKANPFQNTNNLGGGFFGQPNSSNPQPSPFNQQAPTFGQQTPAFGQQTPAFGQQTPTFGQQAPTFGQQVPSFGQQTPSFGQQTPSFGQQTPSFGQPGATNSMFNGGGQQNNTLFNQPNAQALPNTTAWNNTGSFNSINQTGMLNTSGNQNSFFGNVDKGLGLGAANLSAFGTPFNSNGAAQNPSFLGQTNNKLGGTTWGVSNVNNSFESIRPVKTKNSKLDGKHLVKCISALDQFENMSKEEVRLAFISSGGQQVIQQQPNSVNNYNKSTLIPSNTSLPSINAFNKPAQFPSFGVGLTTNANIFPSAPSAFEMPLANTCLQPNNLLNNANSPVFSNSPSFGNTKSLFDKPTQNNNASGSFLGNNPGLSLLNQAATGATMFNAGQPTGGLNFGQTQQQNQGLMSNNTPNFMNQQMGTQLFPQSTNQNQMIQQQTTQMMNQRQMQFQSKNNFCFQPTTNQILSNFNSTFSNPNMSIFDVQPMFGIGSQGLASTQASYNLGSLMASSLFKMTESVDANKTNDQPKTPFDQLIKSSVSLQQEKKTQPQNAFYPQKKKQQTFFNFETPNFDFNLQQNYSLPNLFPRSRLQMAENKLKNSKIEDLSSNISMRDYFKNTGNNIEKLLPKIGSYKITPSLDYLKEIKKIDQLKKINNVTIYNNFGSIFFKQPIDLTQKNIEKCVSIGQDHIEINDSEWEMVKCELTFYNFGSYCSKNNQQKERLYKKIVKWIQKMNMKLIKHDKDNGDLVTSI